MLWAFQATRRGELMPDIPKLVTLDLEQRKLFVDGVEFPWYLDEEGPSISLTPSGELHRVTLTFLAEDTQVIPEEARESTEVFMARQRLADAWEHLARTRKQAEPGDERSPLYIEDAMLEVQRATADLKYAQECAEKQKAN